MVGSNTDSDKQISLLSEISSTMGASSTDINEAMKSRDCSNTDSSKIMALLKLIANNCGNSGGGGGSDVREYLTEEDANNTFNSLTENIK